MMLQEGGVKIWRPRQVRLPPYMHATCANACVDLRRRRQARLRRG
jgi:hypothetical protein